MNRRRFFGMLAALTGAPTIIKKLRPKPKWRFGRFQAWFKYYVWVHDPGIPRYTVPILFKRSDETQKPG